MELTNKQLHESLSIRLSFHVYEVRDEKGNRYRHCGKQRDADYHVMNNPGYSWEIVYLDPPPQTVDVKSETLPPDPQLPSQKILPENQQEPLDL